MASEINGAQSARLSQRDVLLAIMQAIQRDDHPVELLLLDGIACLWWKINDGDDLSRVHCSAAANAWIKQMQSDLVDLGNAGMLQRVKHGFKLTDGRDRLNEIGWHGGEAERVRHMAMHVRDSLGIRPLLHLTADGFPVASLRRHSPFMARHQVRGHFRNGKWVEPHSREPQSGAAAANVDAARQAARSSAQHSEQADNGNMITPTSATATWEERLRSQQARTRSALMAADERSDVGHLAAEEIRAWRSVVRRAISEGGLAPEEVASAVDVPLYQINLIKNSSG